MYSSWLSQRGAPHRARGGRADPIGGQLRDGAVLTKMAGEVLPGSGDMPQIGFGFQRAIREVLAFDGGAWENVPKAVWEYSVGGFQVLLKWLSYRHVRQTREPLPASDIDTVTQICRRIHALVALEEKCDRVYDSAATNTLQVEEPEDLSLHPSA